jgi:hypothetical protein
MLPKSFSKVSSSEHSASKFSFAAPPPLEAARPNAILTSIAAAYAHYSLGLQIQGDGRDRGPVVAVLASKTSAYREGSDLLGNIPLTHCPSRRVSERSALSPDGSDSCCSRTSKTAGWEDRPRSVPFRLKDS